MLIPLFLPPDNPIYRLYNAASREAERWLGEAVSKIDEEAKTMRKDEAALRNTLILAGTIIALIIISGLIAKYVI
ncbi:MAG: hypothetical protein R6T87_05390 [Marinobacter sp.]